MRTTRDRAAHEIWADTFQAIENGSEPGPAYAERDAAIRALDAGTEPGEVLRLWRDGAYAPQPSGGRMDTQPMKAAELGQFVCVAHGGCLHRNRTITSDGVWVRQGPGGPFSSAHRDCYERWAATERGDTLFGVSKYPKRADPDPAAGPFDSDSIQEARMVNGQTRDEGYADEQADYQQADYEPGEWRS